MGRCKVDRVKKFDFYGVSKEACANIPGSRWENAFWNFDDIGQSLVTLYVLSTLEGWPTMLGSALDANDPEVGPIYNNSSTNALFFIVFILIGTQSLLS